MYLSPVYPNPCPNRARSSFPAIARGSAFAPGPKCSTRKSTTGFPGRLDSAMSSGHQGVGRSSLRTAPRGWGRRARTAAAVRGPGSAAAGQSGRLLDLRDLRGAVTVPDRGDPHPPRTESAAQRASHQETPGNKLVGRLAMGSLRLLRLEGRDALPYSPSVPLQVSAFLGGMLSRTHTTGAPVNT